MKILISSTNTPLHQFEQGAKKKKEEKQKGNWKKTRKTEKHETIKSLKT